MIYLDNAATTLIKPKNVYTASCNALRKCGNPGRGGHAPSVYASDKIYECRVETAKLFHMEDKPENVVFTLNATHALNIAIKSILHNGGHAVISSMEHNSVLRPLNKLKENGVTYSVAHCPIFDNEAAVNAICDCIDSRKTDCVIIDHISNVFGYELPIYRIDELCHARGIPLIIDASQSAGINDINIKLLKSTVYICFPGHKSLFGPQGTGCLLSCKVNHLYSIMEGGTGSNSIYEDQPDFLPDIYESGTQNSHGIAALCEGIKYIRSRSLKDVSAFHKELTVYALERLFAIPAIKVYSGPFHTHGVISFRGLNKDCEELAEELNRQGIFVRAGLQCAPLAHKTAGTLETGTVRVSFSVFNTFRDIDILCYNINRLIGKKNFVFY